MNITENTIMMKKFRNLISKKLIALFVLFLPMLSFAQSYFVEECRDGVIGYNLGVIYGEIEVEYCFVCSTRVSRCWVEIR